MIYFLVVGVIVAVLVCIYEARKYPICPFCGHNLGTVREGNEVICRKHGRMSIQQMKLAELQRKIWWEEKIKKGRS